MRETKLKNVRVIRNEPGRAVGGMILFALLAPQAYFFAQWLPDHAYEPSQFFVAFYILFIGAIFLASYYVPEKSYIFRAFLWFCEHASAPGSRKMAFFYFGLSCIVGVTMLVHA